MSRALNINTSEADVTAACQTAGIPISTIERLVSGGTRVVHGATFEPVDRWTVILVRLGRRSLEARVEAHLRALKERAEMAERSSPAA